MKQFNLILIALLLAFGLVGFGLGVNIRSAGYLSGLGFWAKSPDTVSAPELVKMLKTKNFKLINVHTPYEGEIEQTDMFVPFDSVAAMASSLPADKGAPLIIYCQTGRMSQSALEVFKSLGYTNVRHLSGGMEAFKRAGGKVINLSGLETQVLPETGAGLPVSWGDLGPKLMANGTIDLVKFRQAVRLTPEQETILTKGTADKIKIDRSNVQFVVDLLWGIGLAQKSVVYDEGPMGKEYKKDVANFASTGGWTLSVGPAMNYYDRFDLIPLSAEQQNRVAEIAKNVYRPCCGNSTYFPDCNHGMAALAIIELLVSGGVDEVTIYKDILAFNAFWFQDTYLTTATYFARLGISWDQVDAKEVMGPKYSSGQGAADIAKKVGTLPWRSQSGTSCGA